MLDERIEKAAIAIFAAQTNWGYPNPSEEQMRALWDGQMDAVRDSFRRLAKAALDSLEDRPADLDWENAEPKELDNRLVEAVTKGGPSCGDGGGKRLFLFDSGGGFLDGGLGPCTRLRLGIPVGSAPIPNLPGVWMDKDGNLLAVSGERRVRIWNNHDWMAEELDDDSGEPSAHGPYTRYSLQTVEEVPWKPESGDSTPLHEGSRTVHLPDVRSFGRLERDKWLAVKTLEESAELVEACKQYLKACDPTDPSGIGREFDDHANCLACYGVNVGGELGDDRDKAKTGWIGHVRDQRRQAMLRRARRRAADGRQPDHGVRHHG